MSAIRVLVSLNDFLKDNESAAVFNFERFNSVCSEAISCLKDHPNSEDDRLLLISSLASSMIVFKPSIPENQFIDLWDRVEATFNPLEQSDPDLQDLVNLMIRS